MKHRVLLAALLAAASSLAYAGSQDAAKDKGDSAYQALDANGDGYISPEEATADPNVAAQFDQLDTDGDSQLDQGEFARMETRSE